MAKTSVQVAERGQVTIPKALRDRYGIEKGQLLTILDLGGTFLLSPKTSRTDQMADNLRDGLLKEGASLEEMLDELRHRRESNGP